jgi:hypothetical protein
VLRWLASYVITPASPASVAADLAVVLAGLPDASGSDVAQSATAAAREAQPA